MIRHAVGGMKNHLLGLLKYLDQNTFEPIVFLPADGLFEQQLKELNVKYHELDISDRISPIRDIRAILRLRRFLKDIQPDLVHIHGNKAALIGRIAARKIAPAIVTVHDFADGLQKRFWFLKRTVERFFCRWSDRIICVSETLKKNLIRVYRMPSRKISFIPNGIDIELWLNAVEKPYALEKLKLSDEFKYIGIAGRRVDFKGYEYVVRAMPEIADFDPDVRLVLVGGNSDRQKLIDLAEELGIKDKVFFLGHADFDMREVYPAFNIVLFPPANKPFGVELLEAMMCKLPIVASDNSAVSEILEDGETAILAKPDSSDIARKIKQLMLDPALANYIAKRARDEIIDNYSMASMADKTVEVYFECLKVDY